MVSSAKILEACAKVPFGRAPDEIIGRIIRGTARLLADKWAHLYFLKRAASKWKIARLILLKKL